MLGSLICGIAASQDPQPAGARMKTTGIARIDAAPVIDGVLDDTVWSQATLVDDMHQIEPVEYTEPTQETRVLIYYDNEALYVGAQLLDSDPEAMVANILRQGEQFWSDELFAVIIDTFNDKRNGYRFQVNPMVSGCRVSTKTPPVRTSTGMVSGERPLPRTTRAGPPRWHSQTCSLAILFSNLSALKSELFFMVRLSM